MPGRSPRASLSRLFPSRLYGSVFGRLLLTFAATVVAFALIIAGMLSVVVREHPRNQISKRLLVFTLEQRAIPPEPAALDRLARELDVDLVVSGPGLEWSSRPGLPPAAVLAGASRPDADFDFYSVAGDRYAMARIGGHQYFVGGFTAQLSPQGTAAILAGPLLLLLAGYANYRTVRRLFQPIRTLKAGADRIRSGDLDHRIETRRRDELGELTRSVNGMTDYLQATLEAKRQLLLAISHELRSPLTRARVLLELMEPGRNRDLLAGNLEEINTLIGALLEAEALADRHRALPLETVSLHGLLREAVAESSGDGRVALHLPAGDRPAVLDALRVRLLVRNLVCNAVKHGGGGPVDVTLTVVDPVFRIAIADRGPGIAPEHLQRLGEPFYRPDSSRRRSTGGHGLGLYLCRRIAESHGGRLDIASRPGEGTTVTATLPLTAGIPTS